MATIPESASTLSPHVDFSKVFSAQVVANVLKQNKPTPASLATTASVPADQWMNYVSNDTKWTMLSIPGTHDSYARLPVPDAQCQRLSLIDQLNAGVRFFDFRLNYTKPLKVGPLGLAFFHGVAFMGGYLHQALLDIEAWYNANPARANEALFVSIKDESGKPTTDDFRQQLRDALKSYPRWLIGNTVLPLSALRGKVQLLRRYPDTNFGIDVSQWPNNANPNFSLTNGDGVKYTVQDFYEPKGKNFLDFDGVVQQKVAAVKTMLNVASGSRDEDTICFNFTSGAPHVPFMLPENFAQGLQFEGKTWPGVNQGLNGALTAQSRSLGFVIMDFPEEPKGSDVLQLIIQANDLVQR